MNGIYTVAIDSVALEKTIFTSRSRREKLLGLCEDLAKNPFQLGDYEQRGGSLRTYQVILRPPFKVTYWVDHAVKEVRVVDIQTF